MKMEVEEQWRREKRVVDEKERAERKRVMLQIQTILQHFYKPLMWLSNFQIIISKHKCGVSSGPILELIRTWHINSL